MEEEPDEAEQGMPAPDDEEDDAGAEPEEDAPAAAEAVPGAPAVPPMPAEVALERPADAPPAIAPTAALGAGPAWPCVPGGWHLLFPGCISVHVCTLADMQEMQIGNAADASHTGGPA
jgi:hypothetical protein